jgi:hypothetical protein
LSPLGSKLIFQFSLHLNPTTKSICRLSGRIPKYTDGSRTHRDILGGAWKDVPTEEKNKRARHTYDRFRLRFPSTKMSHVKFVKWFLWHYRVVNLQDTLSGSNYGELSDFSCLWKPSLKMRDVENYQNKVKREKTLHLVGCSTGALIRLKKLIDWITTSIPTLDMLWHSSTCCMYRAHGVGQQYARSLNIHCTTLPLRCRNTQIMRLLSPPTVSTRQFLVADKFAPTLSGRERRSHTVVVYLYHLHYALIVRRVRDVQILYQSTRTRPHL